MKRELSLPLFWQVCLINGVVFVLGSLALVISPATVSRQPIWSEVVVLVVGLAGIVALNAALLRSVLLPLDRLGNAMTAAELAEPGRRLDDPGRGPARPLVRAFNAMLDRLESEQAASTVRALHAQEAERQRIAQELHDEVGQSLTAVLLGLKRAADRASPEVAAELGVVRDTTRTSLEEVRRISQRLRPGVLADLGLRGALSSLASDLTARSGIRVDRGFAPGLPDLSSEIELVVYRVAQEALTNVARHARASDVDLRLTRRGGTVVLLVSDNGVGIGDHTPGTGIQGMHERAQVVGGRLRVAKRDGGGTEVTLEIPGVAS